MAARRGSLLEPLGHPDLVALGRSLRRQLDDTLEAEQSAARTAARRRRSLRDLLLDLEDRSDTALIWAADGRCYRGVVEAVGLDHAALANGENRSVVALAQVVALETVP